MTDNINLKINNQITLIECDEFTLEVDFNDIYFYVLKENVHISDTKTVISINKNEDILVFNKRNNLSKYVKWNILVMNLERGN